ncbi:MAG: V-type ATP synthase subunit F [Eubacteriales bacterium]|nr:V-type ATP synthase subunit F [Eubacteriales bacterium]
MYKIAVMGDRDSIYGFAAIGFEPFPMATHEEAAAKLKELVEDNYAVIYITEALAEGLEKEILHYSERELPAIILIPGVSGNTGKGIMAVKRSVEQAVGSDIIFGND